MEAFFNIINLLSIKFDNNGFKGIINIVLTIMTFFIGISPSLIFLFLYNSNLLIEYNIILISALILSASFILFALIFSLTLIFSAIILQKRIEYQNNLTVTDENNFLFVTNIILTSFILSLFSATLAISHYFFYNNSYSDKFNSTIILILFILIFYILVSLATNIIWFKSNK